MNLKQQDQVSLKISEITFSEILPFWSNQLWQGRQSLIEPTSQIKLNGGYDLEFTKSKPYFIAAQILIHQNLQTIGVLSGFKTGVDQFRIRGLWVDSVYRKNGIATSLMHNMFQRASKSGCSQAWTMPRMESWIFYSKFGFTQTQVTEDYEFGPHCFAIKAI